MVVFHDVVRLTGHFTLNWAMIPLTVTGLVVPAGVLLRLARDKELDAAEQSKTTGYVWCLVDAAVLWVIYDQGASTVQAFAPPTRRSPRLSRSARSRRSTCTAGRSGRSRATSADVFSVL